MVKLTFKKFVLLDLLAVIGTYLYDNFFNQSVAAIGIIGGADGPTAIFVSGDQSNGFIEMIIKSGVLGYFKYILIFVILLLLFKPIKMISRK